MKMDSADAEPNVASRLITMAKAKIVETARRENMVTPKNTKHEQAASL
jgi:hypothetical protein